jgi:hypothetical protein
MRVALDEARPNKEVNMKNRVRVLSIGIALAAVAAVYAQGTAVTADVPFNFYVGSKLMPADAYRINQTSNHGIAWLVSAHTAANQGVTTFNVAGSQQVEPARLVFHRYGEEYFLSEIWSGDGSIGRAVARSPREKELSQDAAAPRLSMIRIALHR